MKQLKQKLLLMAVLLLCAITVSAYDFEATNSDGKTIYYSYVSKEDKTVEVVGSGFYNAQAYSGKVVIPSSVGYNGVDYTVVSIAQEGMRSVALEEVVIPNSVMSIGAIAFRDCTSLKSVNIPNSVTSIGASAFYDCTSLKSVEIPNSVTSIGSDAFRGCTSLTSVVMSASLEIIGVRTFYCCTNLAEITIPANVYSIGASAFYGCSNLKKITMLPQRPPVCDSNSFNYYSAEVYVPASTYNAYISAPTWMEFRKIITYDGSGVGLDKCSAPEITFSDKTLSFSCATPQSQIHYSYYLGNMGTAEPDSDLTTPTNKSNSIIVIAYATAEGYEQSAAVIKSFPFDATVHDINGDNKVTIADVTTLIDIIVNK